jgi:hypothetical protein
MSDTIDNLSFDYADHKIKQLIDQLEADRLCSWCVGRALAANGADLLAAAAGRREAIETLADLALAIAKGAPIPGPDTPQH